MDNYDVVVVGGGIAGISIAYELAADRSVCLVDQEASLAVHTTGRSAAGLTLAVRNETVRALTRSSLKFLLDPPVGFDRPIVEPRSTLWFATEQDNQSSSDLQALLTAMPQVREVNGAQAREICPIVRSERMSLFLLDPGASNVDVHALHQGYVKGFLARGGTIEREWRLTESIDDHGAWKLRNSKGHTVSAQVVVNAAGAWSDLVATSAQAQPVGLLPLRRTLFVAGSPAHRAEPQWPTLFSLAGDFYLKPDSGKFLCSPMDSTLEAPRDTRPDELEISRAIDSINEVTTLNLRHVSSAWAGQRTHSADGNPVVGFDPDRPGFFWFAGQGGLGIQTAPAMAALGSGLIRANAAPAALVEDGVDVDELTPMRFRTQRLKTV
jgi:D-arginine dehydrogenase